MPQPFLPQVDDVMPSFRRSNLVCSRRLRQHLGAANFLHLGAASALSGNGVEDDSGVAAPPICAGRIFAAARVHICAKEL